MDLYCKRTKRKLKGALMGKSAKVQHEDEAIAHELDLRLSPFTVTLKHTAGFTKLVKQLVFGYVRDGQVFYDTATTWQYANGMRCKRRRFVIHPNVLKRLNERSYNRWYFHDGTTLIPMQIAKMTDLLDYFYLVEDPDPRYHTTCALMLPETQLIDRRSFYAKKPKPVPGALVIKVKRRQLQTA